MIRRIISIIYNEKNIFENDIIQIKNHKIQDADCIIHLRNEGCIEDYLDTASIFNENVVSFNIIVAELYSLGIFDSMETFIIHYRYLEPTKDYYIGGVNCYNTDKNVILETYRIILTLISTFKSLQKYDFNDGEIDYSVIQYGNDSFVISYDYTYEDLKRLSSEISSANYVIEALSANNEKQRIFINEIASVVAGIKDRYKFSTVIENINTIYERADTSYLFYLNNFSFNKIKSEIDTKMIDLTQKIQGIINDAQTKLIAIPTAFVLAAINIDIDDITSMNNIVVLISLYVFAILIQLFINNQKSCLRLISDSITDFNEEYKNIDIKIFSQRYRTLQETLSKQNARIIIIQRLLWSIPILLTIMYGVLIINLKLCIIHKILALPMLLFTL